MANLDDFFAKKDRKKGKSKPKFLTAEELVKNLEDTSKRETTATAVATKTKKNEIPGTATIAAPEKTGAGSEDEKIQLGGGGTITSNEDAVEEEWKDFEEEQRKDYSGLKIGQLTLNDDDDQSSTEGDDDDADSENNAGNEYNKRSGGGPWKKLVSPEEVTQIPMEIEKPVNPSKVYVSPAFRMQNQGAAPSRTKPRRTAPDITNAEYFPTLGAARPEEQRKKRNEPAFEEVRHGGRIQRVQEQAPAPTAATNRFQTLDDDDS